MTNKPEYWRFEGDNDAHVEAWKAGERAKAMERLARGENKLSVCIAAFTSAYANIPPTAGQDMYQHGSIVWSKRGDREASRTQASNGRWQGMSQGVESV